MLTRRHRAPTLRSIDLLPDGVSVIARFDQALRSAAPSAGWSFEADDVALDISDAVIEGANVLFTVAQPFGTGADYAVYADQVLTGSYDTSTGSLTGGGVAVEIEDIVDRSVGNLSALVMPGVPAVVSAVIGADGETLTITFDESISGSATLGLTLSDSETITSGEIAGAALTLTISTVNTGDVRTFSYDSGTGTLAGLAGDVASITDHAITNNSAQAVVVSCAYPLDDDGTVATAFTYLHAGPAVGADSQSMDYTAAATGGALLAPAGVLGAARWSRPGSGKIVWEGVNDVGTTANGGVSLLCVVSDAGGSMLEVGSVVSNTVGGVLAFTVDAAGAIVGYRDNTPVAITWLSSAPTVGATDKVAAALFAGCDNIGEVGRITLRTNAADITGSYGAGCTDPCGNAL